MPDATSFGGWNNGQHALACIVLATCIVLAIFKFQKQNTEKSTKWIKIWGNLLILHRKIINFSEEKYYAEMYFDKEYKHVDVQGKKTLT